MRYVAFVLLLGCGGAEDRDIPLHKRNCGWDVYWNCYACDVYVGGKWVGSCERY